MSDTFKLQHCISPLAALLAQNVTRVAWLPSLCIKEGLWPLLTHSATGNLPENMSFLKKVDKFLFDNLWRFYGEEDFIPRHGRLKRTNKNEVKVPCIEMCRAANQRNEVFVLSSRVDLRLKEEDDWQRHITDALANLHLEVVTNREEIERAEQLLAQRPWDGVTPAQQTWISLVDRAGRVHGTGACRCG